MKKGNSKKETNEKIITLNRKNQKQDNFEKEQSENEHLKEDNFKQDKSRTKLKHDESETEKSIKKHKC